MPRWDARIEAAGKVEEQTSQEAWLRWQADQLHDDARLTAPLLKTEAAVEADRQAERDAWQAKQARLNQLGESCSPRTWRQRHGPPVLATPARPNRGSERATWELTSR